MEIERHVFGSRTGYETLAQSPGVTVDVRRALETIAFGQTNDAKYLRSLASRPAYISRSLGTSRCVTRVMQGHPDDHGRATLLFVTAVIAHDDWISDLRGDVEPLLRRKELWRWDGAPELRNVSLKDVTPSSVVLDRDAARRLIYIISEIERCVAGHQRLLIGESACSVETVRAIEMLIPDRAKTSVSVAARSLSSSVAVTLNCVANGINLRASRSNTVIYRPGSEGVLAPYAQVLLQEGLLRGNVPWDIVRTYRGFGDASATGTDANPMAHASADASLGSVVNQQPSLGSRRERTPMSTGRKIALGFVGFVLLASSILGYGLYQKRIERLQMESDRAAATELVNMDPLLFAKMPSLGRVELLANTDPSMMTLGNGNLAERLGQRRMALAALHHHVDAIEHEIAGLLLRWESLDRGLSALEDQQLPPSTLDARIQDLHTETRQFLNKIHQPTRIGVEPPIVIEHAVVAEVMDLRRRQEAVITSRNSRHRRFNDVLSDLEREIDAGRRAFTSKEAGEILDDLKDLRKCARGLPGQLDKLKELESKFEEVATKHIRERMSKVPPLAQIQSAQNAEKLKRIKQQCADALSAAGAFENVFRDIQSRMKDIEDRRNAAVERLDQLENAHKELAKQLDGLKAGLRAIDDVRLLKQLIGALKKTQDGASGGTALQELLEAHLEALESKPREGRSSGGDGPENETESGDTGPG